jgi:hypothetical protein
VTSLISIQYVIIICNDVTRASLNKVGQNLLTTHFLASLHVCHTIEGLRLAYYAFLLQSWLGLYTREYVVVWSFISTAIAFCCYCQVISII